jgi:Flp pilus assembly protein TadG
MDRLDSTNIVGAAVSNTVKCPKSIPLLRPKGSAGGQTTVEFALICIPFFAILFAIIDFAQIYFYENSLQNAMREAARFATSGRVIQAKNANGTLAFETNSGGVTVPKAINDSSGQEASRNECIRYWFLSNCVLQNFPISNIVITSATTLPGVPPDVSTNDLGQLSLLSGYNVTTNASSGTVSTNQVPAIRGPGGANDYVQVTATYYVNTITPLMAAYRGGFSRQGWSTFPVHVSAIVKNEPALLNFQHTAIYANEP